MSFWGFCFFFFFKDGGGKSRSQNMQHRQGKIRCSGQGSLRVGSLGVWAQQGGQEGQAAPPGLWRVPGCTQEVRTWERVLTPPEGFQMLHPTPKTDVPQPLPPEGAASLTLCSCSVAKPRRHPPLPQVSAQCHLPWEASPDGSTQNDNSHSPFSSSSIQTTSSPMPPLGYGLGMTSRPGQPEPQ